MGTSVDRTLEFHEVCTFLGAAKRAPLMKENSGAAAAAADPNVTSLADFHQAASSISGEIFTTSQKLSELTKLVRMGSGSLFNDPSEKISSYVHSISEDIRRLNSKLESAQSYVEQKRTQQGSKKSQVADHSVMVVGELKSSLINATKSFKDVVQQRTTNVKEQQERKKEFGQNSGGGGLSKLQRGRPKVYGSPLSSVKTVGGGSGSLPRPNGTSASLAEQQGDSGFGGGSGSGGDVRRPGGGIMAQSQQQQQPLIPDTSYYESRAEAVSEIEAHILELGSVFGRLGELVADHQELTERLHENTLSTVENVDLSYGRLKRTLTQLQSNKTLALKLAAVGVTFTTFFIVFLA